MLDFETVEVDCGQTHVVAVTGTRYTGRQDLLLLIRLMVISMCTQLIRKCSVGGEEIMVSRICFHHKLILCSVLWMYYKHWCKIWLFSST
jgi:hypothetical protein